MKNDNPDPMEGTILVTATLRNDGQHHLVTTMSFLAMVNETTEGDLSENESSHVAADMLQHLGRTMLDEALDRLFHGKTGGFNFAATNHTPDTDPRAVFAQVQWLIPRGATREKIAVQIIPGAGAKRQQVNEWNTIIARCLIDLAYATVGNAVEAA